LKEALRFFQGFPLFFNDGRIKHSRLLHHSYFPTPGPVPLSHMPYRGLCYLNALPVMHFYPATGYLIRDGETDFRLRVNQVDQRINPTRSRFNVSAPSGLVQPIAQHYPSWRVPLPGANKPWNSLSPDEKEHLVLLRANTPPSLIENKTTVYLDTKDGSLFSSPGNNRMMIHGQSTLGPIGHQRIRVRDYEPNPYHMFWDNAGIYEWDASRNQQSERQARDMANFVARMSKGSPWHVLTILYDTPEFREDGFSFRPLYMADPYSVLLYALRHDIIPAEVYEKDYQWDRRCIRFSSWDLYETKRKALLTKINPRLKVLMEALYADRPATLNDRRYRRRSRYERGLRELPKSYRDNRE